MRIERIVADSFAKASERTRKLYGSDCMVLSTSNVGDITEILVAIDTPANDASVSLQPKVDIQQAIKFGESLTDRITKPKNNAFSFMKRDITADAQTNPQEAGNDAEMMGQGQVLVTTIREELRAMERRLTHSQAGSMSSTLVRLLEQGVSARYAESLLNESVDTASMAAKFVADLKLADPTAWLSNLNVVVCGPSGAGKTTLVMQLATTVGHTQVSSIKDTRIGARERFFTLADRANVDGAWGGQAPTQGILDCGALTPIELQTMEVANSQRPAVVCLPAHLGRAATAEWLRLNAPILGVVLTHWNNREVPLGLLSQLAEARVPLKGLSSSADVTAAVNSLDSDEITGLIARKLELVLYTEAICG
jgi:hypothetical protein